MYSYDDIAIHATCSYTQNIDYLSQDDFLQDNYNLFKCLKFDNHRISNSCWRRMYKNLHNLPEINPWIINWDKISDITWLYGPKFESNLRPLTPEENENQKQKQVFGKVLEGGGDDDDVSDYSDDYFDNSDVSSMSLIDSGYYADYSPSSDYEPIKKLGNPNKNNASEIHNHNHNHNDNHNQTIRGIIKSTDNNDGKIGKKVVFNFKINQREIINGMIFDYDILDEHYL
jgi:hypothetical protein